MTRPNRSQPFCNVSLRLCARARCGAVRLEFKGIRIVYCSGDVPLRRPLPSSLLSFSLPITLPVRFCQGRFNSSCNSAPTRLRLVRLFALFTLYPTVLLCARPEPWCLSSLLHRYTATRVILRGVFHSTTPQFLVVNSEDMMSSRDDARSLPVCQSVNLYLCNSPHW